jgi:uncharacterized protein YkwD
MKTKKGNQKITTLKKQFHRHLKMALVPHKANQYRPHATRRYGLVVLLLLVIGLQAGYNLGVTGSVLGKEEAISSADLLSDTNTYRIQQHLQPLTADDKLSRAAFLKAQDMLQKQYWAHTAPDGTEPWKWFGDVGYNYVHAGENLAKNFRSAQAVTDAWMNSPEHRANVLDDDYGQVGFAVVSGELQGSPVTLVVAMYASQAMPAVVAGSQTQIAPPTIQSYGLISRVGLMVQSLTPAAIGSVVLLIIATAVALAAHAYRHKLPKAFKKSWYIHHGAYKAAGLASLIVMIVSLYGGGQI